MCERLLCYIWHSHSVLCATELAVEQQAQGLRALHGQSFQVDRYVGGQVAFPVFLYEEMIGWAILWSATTTCAFNDMIRVL